MDERSCVYFEEKPRDARFQIISAKRGPQTGGSSLLEGKL